MFNVFCDIHLKEEQNENACNWSNVQSQFVILLENYVNTLLTVQFTENPSVLSSLVIYIRVVTRSNS